MVYTRLGLQKHGSGKPYDIIHLAIGYLSSLFYFP